MSLEDALAGSSNYVAAYIEQYFGLEVVANSMRAFGIDIKPPYNPSLIIGSGGTTPISIATAYNGLLANQGRATASYSVSRITDPTGAIVYDRALTPPAPGKQVVSPEAATETAKAMERVIEIGTAKGAINQPAGTTAAKTGTATNLTDVWTTATQCDALVGARTTLVWKGFDTPATLPKGTSSADAARVVDKIFNGTPNRDTNCSLTP
jgi:penicillin-binding protein 1B